MNREIPRLQLDDLRSQFPGVFADARWVDVGVGWLGIIERFIADARQLDPGMTIRELKEKFGSLRIYAASDFDEVDQLRHLAESRSQYACEICGAEGGIRRPPEGRAGWWHCLCAEHVPDYMEGWLPPPDKPPRWSLRGRWYQYDRAADAAVEIETPAWLRALNVND